MPFIPLNVQIRLNVMNGHLTSEAMNPNVTNVNVANSMTVIEITSWLVSAYDFYSRVVKDR